jgi:hypothetical protein
VDDTSARPTPPGDTPDPVRVGLLITLDRLNDRLQALGAVVTVDIDDAQDLTIRHLRAVVDATRQRLAILNQQ